jgi:hypothetical protein
MGLLSACKLFGRLASKAYGKRYKGALFSAAAKQFMLNYINITIKILNSKI